MKHSFVYQNKIVLLATSLLFVAMACTHDPFPAPPPGNGDNPNDTTNTPIDTNDPVSNGKPCDPDTIYYARDVQPILTANCAYAGCHDAGTSQNGVRLTDYNSTFNTGDVRPGDLSGSDLYEVITETDPDKVMPPPPNSTLNAAQIAVIRKWILQGAQNLSCDACDTTNLNYNGKISALFQRSCASCHSGSNPSGGRKLTNYQEVKDALLNSNLLRRINAEAGVPVMPPGGKMDDCSIKQIEIWYNEGMIQ